MIFKISNKSQLPKNIEPEQDKYNQSFRDDLITDLNSLSDLDNYAIGHIMFVSRKKKVNGSWTDRTFYHTTDSGYSSKNDVDWFDDYTYPGWYMMDAANTTAKHSPTDLSSTTNMMPIVKGYRKGDPR